MTKRLRVFAGPNGSGKSTIQSLVSSRYSIGHFVNADNIEKMLKQTKAISFSDFHISISPGELKQALSKSGFKEKQDLPALVKRMSVRNNILRLKEDKKGDYIYLGAILSELIRNKLLEGNEDFSFETVMSHISKLEFLKEAKLKGFKTYLYFVSMESPNLNKLRVQTRVQSGGHDVPDDKIVSRYYRSLDLAAKAIDCVDRAFIFDNSNYGYTTLLAEKDDDEIQVFSDEVPSWFIRYVADKLFG